MTLKELFPQLQRTPLPKGSPEWISVAQGDSYLNFPRAELTARELKFLELLALDNSSAGQGKSAWQRYLIEKKGQLPTELDAYQFIYFNHQEQLDQELIDIISSVLGQVSERIPISPTRTAFLIEREESQDSLGILTDIMPTLENDFGQTFRVFVGNRWSSDSLAPLSSYFEEENKLFSAYLTEKSDQQVTRYPELMLWSLLAAISLKAMEAHFNHCLVQNKDISDIIVAMWQSQGNLVQSAQKLYIHRNSLQYKLDKLKMQTGLNLKNLDDLAFAYLYFKKN
ncbi:helix-turn-helix domain-containing protein [Streptococcus hongkongensis]|nr:PucR family transcriptional regulator [Streptococcus uberis]